MLPAAFPAQAGGAVPPAGQPAAERRRPARAARRARARARPARPLLLGDTSAQGHYANVILLRGGIRG